MIYIKSSSIQFKNPQLGQPTRAVEEHYNGRRVTFEVDGNQEMVWFTKEELVFNATEEDMIAAIEARLNAE